MFSCASRRLLIGLAIFVVPAGLLLLLQVFTAAQDKRAEMPDYGSLMVQYTKDGRYDDAIQTGLKSLHNDPTDGAVYQQIVIVYLIRAQKDATQRGQWILQAISYADKALSADPNNPVNLRDLAFDFAKAGDFSNDRSCQYYRQALDLSHRAVALLHEDHISAGGQTYPIDRERREFTAYGHTFRIEPLLKASEKLSEGVKTKLANTGCK